MPPQSHPDPADPAPPGLLQAEALVLARTPAQCFWHGVVQALPFLLVLIPFGVLFGVVATGAGMPLTQVMGFSILVLAGASQFTAVQLLADNVPTVLVIVSALAINLRMAMYSASMVPWLGAATLRQRMAVAYLLIDQTYAISIQQFETHPRLSVQQRVAYFMGAALVACPPWALFTLVGATLGNFIPAGFPLDFAVPITFLAMIAPMLRTPAQIAACVVSVIAALAFAGLPNAIGLLIAAPLGMAAGAWVEARTEGRKG